MQRFFIMIFSLLIYVKTSHAVNEDFYKQALETIGHHLSAHLNHMHGKISAFPHSYLNNTVNLYIECKNNKEDSLFKFLEVCLRLPYGTTVTIKHNGITLSIDENHDIFVNNRILQADIKNQEELNNAINNNRWIFIKLLLRKIALSAESYLLKSPKTYNIAKDYASNRKVPSELRKILLIPFIESDDLNLNDWALLQPISTKTKEIYLQKLVTKCLSKGDSLTAETLIWTHLDHDTEAFEKNAHCLYTFYRKNKQDEQADDMLIKFFPLSSPVRHNLIKDLLLTNLKKNDLSSIEIILNKFSAKGSESYENLAQELFYYHFNNNDVYICETVLKKHFNRGDYSCNKMTKILCCYLAKQNKYDEARYMATNNMNISSIDYLTLDRFILMGQVEYLKSKN